MVFLFFFFVFFFYFENGKGCMYSDVNAELSAGTVGPATGEIEREGKKRGNGLVAYGV